MPPIAPDTTLQVGAVPTNRLYLDIWNTLKARGSCRIACHSSLHRRVIHAVINMKYYDVANKFQLNEIGRKSRLSYKCTKTSIEFSLTQSLCSKSLTLTEV